MVLTVYFEDPFWVGVFEREEPAGCAVARFVFGGQPSDVEVYRLLQDGYGRLAFTRASADGAPGRRHLSPKRAQREAARALERAGPGTRAQQALQAALEERREAAAQRSRAQARAEAERRYQDRVARRKKRHRGH
jgi:hypothetical protein